MDLEQTQSTMLSHLSHMTLLLKFVREMHIQLMVTNVRLPKIHKIPTDVDFESSTSRAMCES